MIVFDSIDSLVKEGATLEGNQGIYQLFWINPDFFKILNPFHLNNDKDQNVIKIFENISNIVLSLHNYQFVRDLLMLLLSEMF